MSVNENGSRILVIDDEEVVHASLQRMLGRQGHEVEAVLSAEEGLKKLRDESYDLVISDLMMPEMNGIELLEQMREFELSVPVLMITGYPSIRTAMQALRLGAVDYLAKPFTRKELLGPVNRTLRGQAGEADEISPGPGPSEATEDLAGPGITLEPGERVRLRKHSWAVYQQDGTVRVGIEASFLASVGTITSIVVPEEAELVEQGFSGIRLETADDEQHLVFMPVSGQVMDTNTEALGAPDKIGAETWLVRLLPTNLEEDLTMLLRG